MLEGKDKLLTGNEAAAWGARLSKVEIFPNFPITPQTECIETIAQWVADGEFDVEYLRMDSEHSVLSAAVGASATGSRVFVTSSSQGLMLMFEELYIASGMRLPMVMVNVSRALSAPIALWCDHNDFLSTRQSGWVMIHAQNNQEVLDSIIMSYKVSEDERVLLPTMINMDGYVLSYTYEPTDIPEQDLIDKFLPKYSPTHAYFDPNKPMIQGTAVLHPDDYTFFREQQTKAMLNAKEVMKEVFEEWKKLTGREYGFVEKYETDDADTILITQGSISTMAKEAIMKMRKEERKVGLLRLRVLRPFPKQEIIEVLKDKKAVALADKNISPGEGGIMLPEIQGALYDLPKKPTISNFVMGLGGSPESIKLFESFIDKAEEDSKKGKGGVYFA